MGTGINTILGIALVILAIIIISALLYGKDQGLLTKLADQALSLGDWFLPDSAPNQLKQQEKLPSNVIQAQNTFVENIKRATQRTTTGYCTLNFDLSGLEKYEMNIGGPGLVTRIVNPKYSGAVFSSKAGDVFFNPVLFENAEIYLFDVKKYSLCFGKEGIIEDTKFELFKDCRPENLCYKTTSLILSKGKLNKNYNSAQFMISLPDKKTFCLIPTHSSWGGACNTKESTINENCLGKIKGMIKNTC